jgi:hypothetical protein
MSGDPAGKVEGSVLRNLRLRGGDRGPGQPTGCGIPKHRSADPDYAATADWQTCQKCSERGGTTRGETTMLSAATLPELPPIAIRAFGSRVSRMPATFSTIGKTSVSTHSPYVPDTVSYSNPRSLPCVLAPGFDGDGHHRGYPALIDQVVQGWEQIGLRSVICERYVAIPAYNKGHWFIPAHLLGNVDLDRARPRPRLDVGQNDILGVPGEGRGGGDSRIKRRFNADQGCRVNLAVGGPHGEFV